MQQIQRPLRALILRLGGVAVLTTMFSMVKYVSQTGVALPEIMFWRQVLAVPLLLGYLTATGGLDRLRTRRIGSHAGRAVIGAIGMLCTFLTSILLPLAEATTLGFTTPLFAVMLSAFIFREAVGPWRWAAVAIGFLGVIIITQPGHAPISPLGTAMGLFGGLIVAIVSFHIRELGRTEEPISVVFYFSLFCTLLTLPFLLFYATSHTPFQWFLLIGIGLVGMLGQLLLTASLRQGAVTSVIVMDYSALVWATLYGWLIWDRLPPLATWLGAPIIIAAGVVVAWREHRAARPMTPSAPVEAS